MLFHRLTHSSNSNRRRLICTPYYLKTFIGASLKLKNFIGVLLKLKNFIGVLLKLKNVYSIMLLKAIN